MKMKYQWQGYIYRAVMRLSHKFHWHYAPPLYPDGDTQLWCQWCGFRMTIPNHDKQTNIKPLFGVQAGKRKS